MQRTFCGLLRPSLELLSVQTSADLGFGEIQHTDRMSKRSLNLKQGASDEFAGHTLDTVDAAAAQAALCKLKQLTSMFAICEGSAVHLNMLEIILLLFSMSSYCKPSKSVNCFYLFKHFIATSTVEQR